MITTDRLILRPADDRDLPTFRAHDADPRVMVYLGPLRSAADSDAVRHRHRRYRESAGYGFLAVERRADGVVLGFCGLKPGAPDTPIAGEVEIGWSFGADHWGQGYAFEAAQASLDWGWAHLDVPAIAAITTAANAPSRKLMDRLGMRHVPEDDFERPVVSADSPLRPHVVYRIARPAALAIRKLPLR